MKAESINNVSTGCYCWDIMEIKRCCEALLFCGRSAESRSGYFLAIVLAAVSREKMTFFCGAESYVGCWRSMRIGWRFGESVHCILVRVVCAERWLSGDNTRGSFQALAAVGGFKGENGAFL